MKITLPSLYKHQKHSVKFLKNTPRVFDMSDPGCVDSLTEYLTPYGWKPIDRYEGADLVAQFHPDTREIEFVEPLSYVKIPCDIMVAIQPVRGTSQLLSPEHRALYYRADGSWGECSAQDYMTGLHQHNPSHYDRKFCTTFSVRGERSLPLTDIQIRVMVAVIADGHFANPPSTRCTVRLKKTRKIERIRELLTTANITFEERTCGGRPDFQVFRFNAPLCQKTFSPFWWGASQAQLEVIATELPHWDSAQDPRPSAGTRFSTFDKNSAEFAQYAFSAAKRPATMTVSVRDRGEQGVMNEWVVHARATDTLIGPGRKSSVFLAPSTDGFKYCFSVPSSFLLLRRQGCIFATGNTGKTRVEIETLVLPALILAPKSLLASAWGNDIKKFAPHLRVSIAHATNREKAFAADADVYITNHDAANWIAKQPASFLKRFKGGTLVVDESSAFKHHTSARSKALAKISKAFEYRRLMSGTPNSNGICDLWHQVFILDDGKRLGKSFFQFRSAVCTPKQAGPGANMIKWEEKPHSEAIVSALIKDIVIRHRFEDCVDIPANHQYSVNFELSPQHMAAYKQLENESVLLLKKSSVTAINAAVLYGKLLQASSGAVYNDDGEYSLLDTNRYELVIDLAEARQHTVVFFHWAHQRDQLIELAKKRKLTYALIDGTISSKKREQIVEHYQAGFYQILFAHPQSAGHGLTLVKGTATIWASPTHNLEHYLQGLKRIHRIGQTQKTETIMVLAPGTVEERVYESLMNKDAKMAALLNYLKEAA
jgi:hypothetical protein